MRYVGISIWVYKFHQPISPSRKILDLFAICMGRETTPMILVDRQTILHAPHARPKSLKLISARGDYRPIVFGFLLYQLR